MAGEPKHLIPDTDMELFTGDQDKSIETSKFDYFRRWFLNKLGKDGILYVLNDEELYAPCNCPLPKAKPPKAPKLFDLNAIEEGGANTDKQLAYLKYNMEATRAYEAEKKEFFQRRNKAYRDLEKARAILVSGIRHPSTAQVIIDSYPDGDAYVKLRSAWEALEKRWLTGDVSTRDRLIEQLKATTDENGLSNRIAIWTQIETRLREMDALPEMYELDDWFQKGTKNEFLYNAVIVRWQTEDGIAAIWHWRDAATVMSTLIDKAPHRDLKGGATTQSPATPVEVKAYSTSTTNRPFVCYTCGFNGHQSRNCMSTKCKDCGAALNDDNRRSHSGLVGCPVRKSRMDSTTGDDKKQDNKVHKGNKYDKKRKFWKSKIKGGGGDAKRNKGDGGESSNKIIETFTSALTAAVRSMTASKPDESKKD